VEKGIELRDSLSLCYFNIVGLGKSLRGRQGDFVTDYGLWNNKRFREGILENGMVNGGDVIKIQWTWRLVDRVENPG
jgi:hypothetical protein